MRAAQSGFYIVKFGTAAGEKSKPDWSYIFSKEYRAKIGEGIRNVTSEMYLTVLEPAKC